MILIFGILRFRNALLYNIPVIAVIVLTFFPSGFIMTIMGSNPECYYLPASFAFGVFCALNAAWINITIISVVVSTLVYLSAKNTLFEEMALIFSLDIVILYLSSRKFILRVKPKHDISYGIYLWAFLIQQTLFFYFGHLDIYLHMALSLLLSVGFGIISFSFFERPGMELGKKVGLNYDNMVDRVKGKFGQRHT